METEKKKPKGLIQKKAGKLLAGFFILMLLLTVLSKAADSLTVAKVETTYPKQSSLTFRVYGNGTVVLGRKKYIRVKSGVTVDRLFFKEGDQIKKGDTLLKLNEEELTRLLEAARDEETKMELALEQSRLQKEAGAGSEAGTKDAEENLRNTKEDLEAAREKVRELEKKWKQDRKKEKKELLRDARKELENAEKACDEVRLSNEETMALAGRNVEDAQKALEETRVKDDRVEKALAMFAGGSYETREDALADLCELLYEEAAGGWEGHQETVDAAEDVLYEAKKDLKEVEKRQDDLVFQASLKKSSAEAAYKAAISTDPDYAEKKQAWEQAAAAYEEAVSGREQSVAAAKKAVKSAQNGVDSVTRPETRLETAADSYYLAVQNKNEENQSKYREEIYNLVYGGTVGRQRHEKAVQEAEKNLERKKEDYERAKTRTDRALLAGQEKVDEAGKRVKEMENGSYDYEGQLEAEKAQIEAAKDTVKNLERSLEAANRGVDKAERQADEAKRAEGIAEQIHRLAEQSARIDLENKKEEIAELERLVRQKGNVAADNAGIILEILAQEGRMAGADPVMTVGLGGYSFEGTAPKEAAEYANPGDTIDLRFPGEDEPLSVEVSHIQYDKNEAGEDIATITADLPKGSYTEGKTASFLITNVSKPYICVPLSAVRMDQSGSFVLLARKVDGILGEELQAVSTRITIIEQDDTMAAVQESFSDEDAIITSSNKNIYAGDRVRLKEQEQQ